MKLTPEQLKDNAERAQRGRNVMDAYAVEVGGKEFETLRDLLADLMHTAAADCECEPFEKALDAARQHFNCESRGLT